VALVPFINVYCSSQLKQQSNQLKKKTLYLRVYPVHLKKKEKKIKGWWGGKKYCIKKPSLVRGHYFNLITT